MIKEFFLIIILKTDYFPLINKTNMLVFLAISNGIKSAQNHCFNQKNETQLRYGSQFNYSSDII